MDTPSKGWYLSAFEDMQRRTDRSQRAQEYFRDNMEGLGLTKAKSLLSIGPGDGRIDTFLMTNCMPNLQFYCAVERNEDEIDALKAAIDAAFSADKPTLHLVNKDVNEWLGPDEPVDVVLLCHMLYDFPDRDDRLQLLKNCFRWLNPGGVAIFAIQTHMATHPHFLYASKFEVVHEYYTDIALRQDLGALGVKTFLQDGTYETSFDYRNRNKAILNFLLHKDASDKETKALDDYFEEILPPGQVVNGKGNSVIAVQKEEFDVQK